MVILISTSAVTIAIALSFFIFGLRSKNLLVVTSEHMMPILQTGDTVEIDPGAFDSRTPDKGEIVYYKIPQYERPSIGRIVAAPNDEVYFVAKRLFVNGQAVQESPEKIHSLRKKNETLHFNDVTELIDGYRYQAWYLDSQFSIDTEFSMKLPADKYFILGDNRSNSADSRLFGPISRRSIIGTVIKIKDSLNKDSVGKSLSRRR